MADLSGQVAIVTGAGRGIGRAVALAAAGAGATVVASARTVSEIEAVAAAIGDAGGTAAAIPADIGSEEDIQSLFAQTAERFGQLDIVVNNAGMGLFGPVAEFDTAALDRIVAVNLRGTFLCCREAMRLMIPRRSGTIVNVSSVVGIKGYPNQAAYTATKHGVQGLTKSLAVEAQEHDIRVSAVLPGGVDTDLAAASRPDLDRSILLQPEDVAQAVLYLLSLSPRASVDQIYIRRRTSKPF
jgi:NAD(P)-dependent dehydrogenase (short-subunit alcohol dehydrogenase family)